MSTETTFTHEGLKELKYAVVELSMMKNPNVTIVGLFLAIRPIVETDTPLVDKSEKFVWLLKDDHVHMLSTKHYKIGSIEIGLGKDAKMHKITAYQQRLSIDRLEAILYTLKHQERVDDNGLIDISTYSDIPGALKKLVGSASTFTEIARKPVISTVASTTSKAATGYTPVTRAKKVVSTTVIKRTTKYRIYDAIEKMRVKTQDIRDNKYEPPDLPVLEADKEEKSKKKLR